MTQKQSIVSKQLFILFSLITIFIQTYQLTGEYRTIAGSFYEQFYGLSVEGFNLYNYLFVTIIYLFPVTIFFTDLFIAAKGDIYYQLIRYPSFIKWFYQLLRKMIVHSFWTISLLFMYTFFLALLFGFPFTWEYPFGFFEIVYHFIVNGFLQLLNYHLILTIFICLTKKTEFILLNIGVLIILGLPLFNAHWLFPVALNSLGYITGGFNQPLRITLILGLYVLIEFIILRRIVSKKLVS